MSDEIAKLKAENARLEAEVEQLEIVVNTYEREIARLRDVILEREEAARNEDKIEEFKRAPGRRHEVPVAVIEALESKFSFDEIMNKQQGELVAGIEKSLRGMNNRTLRRHVAKARMELGMRSFVEELRAK
jgi:hypothetical protein